jgi:Calcineurin-like phosphoesterase
MEEMLRASFIRRKAGELRLGSVVNFLFWLGFMTGCTMVQQRGESQAIRFEFGVIGDQQYTVEDEAKFPNLIDALNEANIAFVIHVGDIETDPRPYNINPRAFKSVPCTNETFYHRRDEFQKSKNPFIFTPGDNEWTDCHEVKHESNDPLERLAKLREIFFQGDQTLGQRTLALIRQSDDPKYSKFRENVRWIYGDVLFVALHIVGSNNNSGRTPEMDAEYNERNAADLAWMKQAFELAKRNGNKAITILIQANPGFQNSWPEARFRRYFLNSPIKRPEKRPQTGYDDFLAALEAETLAFKGPVLMVHGDSHIFRIDQPLVNSTTGRFIENFTRLETFGTPDVHWVRVIVDRNDPNVFTFKPEIVKKNLVDHSLK